MNISAWSIEKPVPAVLLFILLTVFGLISFHRMGIQNFPDMDLPTIQISAALEGAAPAQLETEVARKIEDQLASLPLLDHVTTTITDGAVSIRVSFAIDKKSETALNEVRNAVDSVRSELPSSMNAPTVSKVTAASSALLTYTASSSKLDEQELSWFIDNDVDKALLAVHGVSKVARIGGVDREVHIDLDPALMAGLGVMPAQVSAQLKVVQKDNSGGRGDVGGQQQSLRTLGAVGSIEEIAALTIPLADGRTVRLDQIAKIGDSYADRSSLAFLNGKPVIGFQVTRSLGFSDVTVATGIRNAMREFTAVHNEVSINEASNAVTHIEGSYRNSIEMLYEGALLAVIVVFLFLRDWRATFVSATALPLSVLPAFTVMYLSGFSLNAITLLALSLVVGILVDDAIVEIENITRHLRAGKNPYEAAMEAADEIGLAVVATTFTLVAVFLPTAFMGGIPGLIFRQFGITASVAVLASLLVARMLTPMMAAYLLKPILTQEHDHPLMTRYLVWIQACLRHRRRTVFGAVLFLVLSFAMIPLLPTGFLPAADSAQTRITLELPPGSTLEQTSRAAQEASQLISRVSGVRQVFAAAGIASTGQGMGASTSVDVTTATLTVELTPRQQRASQSAVEETIRQQLQNVASARVSVGAGGNGEALAITLASDDPIALETASAAVEQDLRNLKGIGNITSDTAMQRPEIQLKPDFARAAALGVTSTDMANTMRLATYGDYSSALPKLNLPQRQIPLRVRVDAKVRTNIDTLGQLRVPGRAGAVSLASLGQITMGSSPAEINRIDRLRNVTLNVELNGRSLGDVNREVRALPAFKNLPAGVRVVNQGELQRMTELFGSFGLAMAIGVFCIYAVLVLLFHDFLQPATILAALPLSVGGALFALLITHKSFSMPTVIGLLMLMGIVTKNSILLVEYAIMARRNGMDRFSALLDACHKRARPIIMTTIAMGAGMLPAAIGTGADPSFRQPMAIVVIGGIITSTLLSLLVVPVIFTYVDDFEQWLRRLAFRKRGA